MPLHGDQGGAHLFVLFVLTDIVLVACATVPKAGGPCRPLPLAAQAHVLVPILQPPVQRRQVQLQVLLQVVYVPSGQEVSRGGWCRHREWVGVGGKAQNCGSEWNAPPPPPKEFCAMARVHRRQTAQKRRKKMGSSVAYKTIGTFLSQKMGHEDASGRATDRCNAVEMQRYAKVHR